MADDPKRTVTSAKWTADTRAVSPVVGKLLSVGLVVLYVGLVTTTLYGGVVPEYRTASADELGERVLATATLRVQAAVPANATAVDARIGVDLPDRIRGRSYEIRATNGSLVLDHPRDVLDRRARPSLPDRVASLRGTWHSDRRTAVRVTGRAGNYTVSLVEDER